MYAFERTPKLTGTNHLRTHTSRQDPQKSLSFDHEDSLLAMAKLRKSTISDVKQEGIQMLEVNAVRLLSEGGV